MLAGVTTIAALPALAAPSSALTVTVTVPGVAIPTITLPPITVPTVTIPTDMIPTIATPAVTTPAVTTPTSTPAVTTPTAATASPSPGNRSDPLVGVPGHEAVTPNASKPSSVAAGRAAAASTATRADVNATIATQPADSFLHRVPTIASRLALWIALAATVFVLYLLVGSAVRQHRRKSPRLS